MPTSYPRAQKRVNLLFARRGIEAELAKLAPRHAPVPPRARGAATNSKHVLQRCWELVKCDEAARQALADTFAIDHLQAYSSNVENFIGTAKIPIGLAGPLRVNGLHAQADYYVPLATTEAALVASYNRGAHLISEAGGCAAALMNEGVSRAPGFAFADLRAAGRFVSWVLESFESVRGAAESTSRHAKLEDLKVTIEGNNVYLCFEYSTADAAGQNMVTLATEAACAYILSKSPQAPAYYFLEANLSGDKKASAQSLHSVRGRHVTCEVVLPAQLVQKRLRTTPQRMEDYWRMSSVGGVVSGNIGIQGHYANGLAALYIACGQDAACVAESAVGMTRIETTSAGDLYAAVTLPNLTVGTVGGGTGLPSQRACLEILGLAGAGKAAAFAELCAGLSLAGELSIIGALCAGDFARAHRSLARERNRREPKRD